MNEINEPKSTSNQTYRKFIIITVSIVKTSLVFNTVAIKHNTFYKFHAAFINSPRLVWRSELAN